MKTLPSFRRFFGGEKAGAPVDPAFLLLLGALFFLFIPYLAKTVWPHNDTGYSFQYFYFFYNDLFLHGDIPRWMPFGLFGIPGDFFQIVDMSPANYFMAVLGCLFRIRDVLLLFKLSVLTELSMLLTGTYLLSRELYRRRSTTIFVSLAVLASTAWHSNLYFNFRIYALLPFMFFFLLKAVRRQEFSWLCLAGLTFFISLLGNLPYYSVLYFYILLLFVLVLLLGERPDLRPFLVPSRRNALLLAALVFTGAITVYFFSHALDGLAILTPSRDPNSGGVSLSTFLTYGGDIGLRKFLGLFYAGPTPNPTPDRILDNTLYAGLLPLVFLPYAFRNVRRTAFAALGAVTFFLVTFSIGDPALTARASFFLLPGIRMFRHIGLVGDMMKLFIPLLAGFGLDQFLTDLKERNAKAEKKSRPALMFFVYGASVLILALFIDFKVNPLNAQIFPRIWPAYHSFALGLLALAVLVLAGAAKKFPKAAGTFAILFLALDLFPYQSLVASTAPRHADAPADIARVNAYPFQSARSDTPVVDRRSFDASKIVVSSSVSTLAYGFIQTDPCGVQYPGVAFRAEYLTQGTGRLIRARGGNPPNVLPIQDPSFMRCAGCNTPKLTLNSNVLFAETEKQAESLVKQASDINQPVVLRYVPEEISASWKSSPDPAAPGDLKILAFTANTLEIKANVTKPGGTWLVYADSWHSGWRATVNGRPAPVAEANLAFKAVKLGEGQQTVRFFFDGGPGRFAGLFAVIFGSLFTAAMLFLLIRILFPSGNAFFRKSGNIHSTP